MATLHLKKQNWELQNGKLLTTLEVFQSLRKKEIDKSILCRCENKKWKPVSLRFQMVDSYGLLDKLGQGGFGKVYQAIDINNPNRLVAMKIPTDDFLIKYAEKNTSSNTKEAKNKARIQIGQIFSQEALLTARLNMCPHVVAVIDHSVSVPYMVLEYCNNGSLANRIKDPYQLKDVISWGIQIATALEAAHSLRPDCLIHRDLKPSNVLIHDNVLKVSDFGTSKMSHNNESLKSLQGGYTAQYAAPEVFDGKASPATDIWAFGVILYQLVSEHFPFEAESMPELIMKVTFKDFVKLDDVQKFSCPQPLQKIIYQCLDKSPEKRPGISDCLNVLKSLQNPTTEEPKKHVQKVIKKVKQKHFEEENNDNDDEMDFGNLGF